MKINNFNSEKTAKFIRIITIAPIMVFVAMTLIFIIKPLMLGGLIPYLLSILFLSVFPILAYPLQKFIPYYRDKGREGQRNFSIVMSLIGYVAGLMFSIFLNDNSFMQILFLTYLLSVFAIAIFSKIIKFKASGHACGLSGPLTLLFYVFGSYALIGAILIPLLFWASIKLKRHTFMQLLIGSIIPILIFVLLIQFI
jgi:hypothetical protein